MSFNPIDNVKANAGKIVSTELFAAISNNLNHLVDSVQPGQIAYILTGLVGVPTPNPAVWQLCDGSLVTDESSKFFGLSTPNLINVPSESRYLKVSIPALSGNTGGSSVTRPLDHNHTGVTGPWNVDPGNEDFKCDNDDDFYTTKDHTHTIGPAQYLTYPTTGFEPSHIRINAYFKIK